MFSGDGFPVGPNGRFPKQRIATAGNELIPPVSMQETYLRSNVAKLPVVEKDFHSSVNRVKGRMQRGEMIRKGQGSDKFRPKMAAKGKLSGEGEEESYQGESYQDESYQGENRNDGDDGINGVGFYRTRTRGANRSFKKTLKRNDW